MSLDKSIQSGKEHRKQYKYKKNYSKSIDRTCRNHGSCEWCRGNRLYNTHKKLQGADFTFEFEEASQTPFYKSENPKQLGERCNLWKKE